MNVDELTAKLIETDDEAAQRQLIKKHRAKLDLQFAEALKNKNYEFWTSDPTKTRNAALALKIIHEFLPIENVRALAEWSAGIAALTVGKANSALEHLEESAQIFRALGQPQNVAQTQVSKLYALALAGKYDEAILTGRTALKVFAEFRDALALGKVNHNLGNICWRRGDYQKARRFFKASQRQFSEAGDERQMIMVEHNLANLDSIQNNFRAAEKTFQEALKRAEKLEMLDTEAKIEAQIGNLNLFRGRYHEALKFLERSREKYARLKMPHQTAMADLEVADVYLELNLLPEALEIYNRVAREFADLKMRAEEARARTQMSKALVRLNKTPAALAELEIAEKLHDAEGNQVGIATVNLIKANLLIEEKQFAAAKSSALAAAAAFAQAHNGANVRLAQFAQGESERLASDFKNAKKTLTNVAQAAKAEELPHLAWKCETSLGLLAQQLGLASAKRHFKNAVKIIEKLRSPLAADEFRTAFLIDKLVPYEALAALSRSRPVESLAWVERARAQSLLDLVTNENNPKISADKKLQATFESLREELNWFYSRINRPSGSETAATEIESEKWQNEISARENRINALVLQVEARRESETTKKHEFDLSVLQSALGHNQILLEFAEFENNFAVFVVSQEKIELIENLASESEIAEILEQLHFQFGALRYGANALEKHLPQLKSRTDKHLQRLYDALLRPLENHLGENDLIIIPTKNLHYVPFHALRAGDKYVAEIREISVAPSAAIWQNLETSVRSEEPARHFEKVLALGFADERVPQVEREVESLGQVMPNAIVLSGSAARFSILREILERDQIDVLHLACHGQFRPENPFFSALHLADGWITVRETRELKLASTLVVLSACETGLSKIAAGDELLGLVRGFLTAGANALVLSLWAVNDSATAVLMQNFYQELLNLQSPSAALRAAQRQFIERSAHPYYWAPFFFIGSC